MQTTPGDINADNNISGLTSYAQCTLWTEHEFILCDQLRLHIYQKI